MRGCSLKGDGKVKDAAVKLVLLLLEDHIAIKVST